MKMYYEKDVDLNILKDKTIAVIGYGSQGMAQSRNMHESGLNVVVGLRENGASWEKAKKDGLSVMTVEDAAKVAAEAEKRAENCKRLKGYMAGIESGARIREVGADGGKGAVLDDSQRATELQNARASYSSQGCQ